MEGASFARFLGTHLIDVHGQQIGSRGRRRSGGVYFVEKILEFRIGSVGGEQVRLARQSGGESVSQNQPLGLGSRAEVAERADDFLTRAFGSEDAFDENV